MGLDNGSRKKESDSHPFPFGREERFKKVRQLIWMDTVATIHHSDFDVIITIRPCLHRETARRPGSIRHRVHPIHGEVDQDLLQLRSITDHQWTAREQFCTNLNTSPMCVAGKETKRVRDNRIE